VSELQHPGSRSFEQVADLYERARPEYPREAVEWIAERLDLREGRTVLDLGAGTGKLTRALVPTGARVIAIDPGERMLAELQRIMPEVEAVIGAAESIPLPDASVDAITMGQAFHWFRHDEAIPELRRVLRPGGGVALIWNTRDHDHPLQREIRDVIAPLVPVRREAHDTSRLEESGLFAEVEERRFPWMQQLDADEVVARIQSVSFVAAASREQQEEVERQLREVVARFGGRIDFHYLTRAYVTCVA
jgi:ubiquinone/menaquinone biosynthesis C-methylase UbiE